MVRPINRLREPTVFLKLEVSSVFADSPMDRCLGPKETSELTQHKGGWSEGYPLDISERSRVWGMSTYGVARLETSLTMISIPLCLATPI